MFCPFVLLVTHIGKKPLNGLPEKRINELTVAEFSFLRLAGGRWKARLDECG